MKKIVIAFLLCLVSLQLFAKDAFVAGKDYRILNAKAPQQKQVSVVEFFNYGCPWCALLDESLEMWLKNKPSYVSFSRVPLTFEQGWTAYARAYYLADALGIEAKISPALFVAIHGKNDKSYHDLSVPHAMVQFFAKHGVKPSVSEPVFNGNSASIEAQVKYGTVLMNQYKVFAIPAFVVANRYAVDLGQAKNAKRMLQILDFLIAKAHKV